MAPHVSCRQAWISSGFNLRFMAQQLPTQTRPRSIPHPRRSLSSSAATHEEKETNSPPRTTSDSEHLPDDTAPTSDVEVSSQDMTGVVGSKAKKPESLKDIFPDLFGNSKPLIAQSGNRAARREWEQSLDDSIPDTNAMIDNPRRTTRLPRASAKPAAIGSTLSSIFSMGSDKSKNPRNRHDPTVTGAKDRTRAAPKELQAFHELLESMFEASEAQAAEIGRQRRGIAGNRRNESGFGMERHGGPRDSYLSDALAGRGRTDRQDLTGENEEHGDRSRMTTIAKPVGSFRNVSEQEMEDYMQKRELIASQRTDLDILEWLNRTYFTSNPSTSVGADEKDFGATPSVALTSSYPLVLAYAISVLHLQIRNPHAALAVFDTVRRYSLESYLVGCTTSVYNEMLRARWQGLGDLKGVEEGLEEMGRRGVGWDKETMRFASTLVEDLVKLRLSGLSSGLEPSPADTPTTPSNDQRLVWAYGPDVFERLARLEEMVENQVEFSERGVRIKMKRRADVLREQEMGDEAGDERAGSFGGREYTPREEARGSFGGRSVSRL